jgi:nitrite reductase/ring-hydroxylating ferredoxin subunit
VAGGLGSQHTAAEDLVSLAPPRDDHDDEMHDADDAGHQRACVAVSRHRVCAAVRASGDKIAMMDTMCTHSLVTEAFAQDLIKDRRVREAEYTMADGSTMVAPYYATLRCEVTVVDGRKHVICLPANLMPKTCGPDVDSLLSCVSVCRFKGVGMVRDVAGKIWRVKLVKDADPEQPDVPYKAAVALRVVPPEGAQRASTGAATSGSACVGRVD